MLDADQPAASVGAFTASECEKCVIKACRLLDEKDPAGAREELMEGIRSDMGNCSALLLMRFIRLDTPKVFGATDISPEEMLSRAQKAPHEQRERAKLFCKYLAENQASSPTSLFLCGSITEKVTDDINAALAYYKKSAELGNAAAQFNIGCFYNSGIVVDVDKEEAAKWFQLAADQGRANALNNLGVLYLSGQGVAQDRKKAAALFKAASERGHAAARKNYLLAIKPEGNLKIPTAGNIQEAPIVSPRDYNEPFDPSQNTESLSLTGGSRKRRFSFSKRFFGDK